MAVVGILNAWGSTVGDNLEHHLLAREVPKVGHGVLHLWNFNRQHPGLSQRCKGVIAGGGGILWQGSPLRDYFFINVIMLAQRAIGVSVGYNQHQPLGERWHRALDKMEFITARDPFTYAFVKQNSSTRAFKCSSVAWLYEPPKGSLSGKYDLGLIYNHKAWEMNYGHANILRDFPALGELKLLEIPFAQPIEQPIIKAEDNPEKLAYRASSSIRKCKTVLTSRLHGFILALVCGVPAILIDDEFKVSSQAYLCEYPFIHARKVLKKWRVADWRLAIKRAQDLPLEEKVEHMRRLALPHTREVRKWLRSL